MMKVLSKNPRIRLSREDYRLLHRQVLDRDGWRCQICGRGQHLEVHHLKLRSQSGADEEQNLITLCAQCHEAVHRKPWGVRP